jgi:hypothetical protein
MALKYEDYAHLAQGKTEETVVDQEIQQAAQQQEDRQESTPDSDWEKRYKELEKAYSRQGQQLGDYRSLVDNYVSTGLDSTPAEEATDSQEVSPITPDDIYENPDEAVRRAVDSHPAIKRAQELEKELEETRRQAVLDQFDSKHPGFQDTVRQPEFVDWVKEDTTRIELIKRADQFDMIAADALMTMWEVTQKAPQAGPTIDDVALESGSGAEPVAEQRYSRSEMLQILTRAKQGDQQAQDFYNAHAKSYREALSAGNVRD